MADDFDSVVKNVKRSSTWMRIVYMIGFCVVLYVVSVVIWFLTAAQALFSVFTGADNRNLRLLGSSLAEYINQILKFITYNSEDRPFPFSPFPEADEETSDAAEAATEDGGQARTRGEAEESGGSGEQSTAQSGDQFDDLAFLSRQEEAESEGDSENPQETAPKDDQSLSASEIEAGQKQDEGQDEGQKERQDEAQKERQEEAQEQTNKAGIQVKKYAPGKDSSNMFSGLKTDTGNDITDAPGYRNDDPAADKSDR